MSTTLGFTTQTDRVRLRKRDYMNEEVNNIISNIGLLIGTKLPKVNKKQTSNFYYYNVSIWVEKLEKNNNIRKTIDFT